MLGLGSFIAWPYRLIFFVTFANSLYFPVDIVTASPWWSSFTTMILGSSHACPTLRSSIDTNRGLGLIRKSGRTGPPSADRAPQSSLADK
jgi:hypothetical protein